MTSAEEEVAGIRTIASAVLSAPHASDGQVSLAIGILEATANVVDVETPREAASIARIFNEHMDTVLDAANASTGKRERSTRRAMMARAIDGAGLVLIDRRVLAAMVEESAYLKGKVADAERLIDRSYSLPVDVESAARFLDDALEHASPEHALQWSIVRGWMTPDAALSSDNSDASRG